MTTRSELDVKLPTLPEGYFWFLAVTRESGTGTPRIATLSIGHRDIDPLLGSPVVSRELDINAADPNWAITRAIDVLHSQFIRTLRWQRAIDELHELARAARED